MDLISIVILRAVERLAGIAIGGFLAWLGYRLFLDIPTKADGSGKLNLPGGAAIHLTRVGPGVFFALFGTGIVLMSFLKPTDFKEQATVQHLADGSTLDVSTRSYSGATSTPDHSAAARRDMRNRRRTEISLLNRLPQRLAADMSDSERADFTIAVPQLKMAVMRQLWGDDWGDVVRFRLWVETGDPAQPPADLAKAVEYFNFK